MKAWHSLVMSALVFGGSLSADAERPVLDEGAPSRVLFSCLRNVPDTPSEQWERAVRMEEAGRMRRARRGYRTLVSRWPAADEAAQAQHRYADLLYARGRKDAAFEAYQTLLERFPHEVPYEQVMERQYRIALDIMHHRRMRFIFGGYQTAENALPKFAWIAEQAPGTEWAVLARLHIGTIHEDARNYAQAVDAYTRVLQLFPDTEAAMKASTRRAVSLYEDSRRRPNDVRRMNEAAFGLEHALRRVSDPEIRKDLSARLDRVQQRRGRHLYERAYYYERYEKNPSSAAIGYRALLKELPDVEPWSEMARSRLAEIESPGTTQEDGI